VGGRSSSSFVSSQFSLGVSSISLKSSPQHTHKKASQPGQLFHAPHRLHFNLISLFEVIKEQYQPCSIYCDYEAPCPKAQPLIQVGIIVKIPETPRSEEGRWRPGNPFDTFVLHEPEEVQK
jgi:hypothetical protein